MEYLTVKEYTELRGCSERYVRKLISEGSLFAEECFGRGGKKGLNYRIPLASLDHGLLVKYRRRQGRTGAAGREKGRKQAITRELEQMTLDERREAAAWEKVINEWDGYCLKMKGQGVSKKDATARYVEYVRDTYPGMHVSEGILYRKKRQYKQAGAEGMVDMRGKHGGHVKAIPDVVFDIFEDFYLDQSRKGIRLCMTLTEEEIRQHPEKYPQDLLPLASQTTFARYVETRIPVPVLKYYRLGSKVFNDECANYIDRKYTDLDSMDILVCDNHTFDIMVDGGESRKPVRVYLTGFLDVRSRKMVGWYVTDAPNSDATLQALRRAIERYGIPRVVYSDNGREFLTHDIGGRGFRKSAEPEGHEPPTILQHLGIEFRTALVRNARAKIIERAFLDVKECFSKLFEGYTGGTIAERPERLKRLARDAGNFCIIDEFREYVDVFMEGWFNCQPHSGSGMGGRTRNEVFAACYTTGRRAASMDELNLMMLRTTRMQTVNRGVKLKIYGTDIRFYSDELIMNHDHEKVYLRYDPDNLSEVRVYDENDRFLCTAAQQEELSYFASKEDVGERMREIRTLGRTVRAWKRQKQIETDNALDLIMKRAGENLGRGGEPLNPKIIELVRSVDGKEPLAMAAGECSEPLDWTKALERMEKAKEGQEESGNGNNEL